MKTYYVDVFKLTTHGKHADTCVQQLPIHLFVLMHAALKNNFKF